MVATTFTGLGSSRAQAIFAVVEDPPVTAKELEAALTPYGAWTDVSGMGRVWCPDAALVGDDFAPYLSNGQWLNGAYGWTFHSNEPWGWAAFHFGRWAFLPDQGWVWTLQGTTPSWTPASVDWRTAGGIVAWLPTLPVGISVDPHQYASLWNVVQLRYLQRADLIRQLLAPERAAFLRVASPPPVGTPVAPLATWRGYPGLRAALAAAQGGWMGQPLAPGSNPILWLGGGSSVHAPIGMGHAAGASQLWTGPGSSVFASPAFGESTAGPSPAPSPAASALGRPARGWYVAPRQGAARR